MAESTMEARQDREASDTPWSGHVTGIFITPRGGQAMRSVTDVRAVAGQGLEGDRYFDATGTFSDREGTGRQITLIESEAVDAASSDYELTLSPIDIRRNIATAGVALNHLVGKEFLVGEVRLRGMRLCEPCDHLAKLVGQPLIRPLTHRGGLRADIVEGGTIREGDQIRPAEG